VTLPIGIRFGNEELTGPTMAEATVIISSIVRPPAPRPVTGVVRMLDDECCHARRRYQL